MNLIIRKLGNSAGIIFPATILRALKLSVGRKVCVKHVEGKIVITPVIKTRYTLSELMALCDLNAPAPEDVKLWDSITSVGKEIV